MIKTGDLKEEGFTLIEIITVCMILGTLSAIALPFFMGQRRDAVEGTLVSDVRNAAMEMEKEAIFSQTGYAPEIPDTFFATSGNTIVIDSSRSNEFSYCIIGSSPDYEDMFVYYHSDVRSVTHDMRTCGFTPMEQIEESTPLPVSPSSVIPPPSTAPGETNAPALPPSQSPSPSPSSSPSTTPPNATSPSTYAPAPKDYDNPKRKKYKICHQNGKGLELPLPAILNGHSPHHPEDIVPVIPGQFTGQNWTSQGSIIWGNNCIGMSNKGYMG